MINLKIDDEIKSQAIEHSAERMKYEYNRFHFNDQRRKNMILVGSIGQLIFKKYLEEKKIKYDFQFQAGRFDDFDFEIDGEICEVKTSGYSGSFSKLNLLYSQDQYEAGLFKGFKYCVQIFIDGFDLTSRMVDISNSTVATIVGYIEFDKIAQYKNPHKQYYGDDYKVPIADLKDIKYLLKTVV